MKKKIVILSGAGTSKESGLGTFRDLDGYWKKYDWQKLASTAGWAEDPAAVLDFYNARHKQLATVKPNHAHELIAELEKYYDVQIITQNVDDLHERAGSTNVMHLHGELCKKCSSRDRETCIEPWPLDETISMGDLSEDGSQTRPYIVWFGEDVKDIELAVDAVRRADIFIIIGTSLKVAPANNLALLSGATKNIIIDPDEAVVPEGYFHIQTTATEGMEMLYNSLVKSDSSSTEEKEEFPITEDTECWDMKRFVHEYIILAQSIDISDNRYLYDNRDPEKKDIPASLILSMMQMYSYACACLGIVAESEPNLLIIQKMFEMKGNNMMDLDMYLEIIKKVDPNIEPLQRSIMRSGADPISMQDVRHRSISSLLDLLGRVAKLGSPYSGLLEASPVYAIGYWTYRCNYQNVFDQNQKKIEDVIVELSDYGMSRPISVDELIAKYNFPMISVEKLRRKEWEEMIDNM